MPRPSLSDISGNGILAALTPDEQSRLIEILEIVELPAGRRLCEERKPLERAWFPLGNALACLSVSVSGERIVDSATVGDEGAVGLNADDGLRTALHSARVISAGRFVALTMDALTVARRDLPSLRRATRRYADFLLTQVFRVHACNAHHSIGERCCRRLLELSRRAGSDEVEVRQDDLAMLVGVGRSFVNRTIVRLKDDGLIDTRRGRIIICDRLGLQRYSCRCSDEIQDYYALAFGE